ncbi:(2Fe-2S)-binding protein [Pseudothauera rhizosphaerae]|uniref:Bacterioferritin-associated ferredoxin n=1 Tax=Pseudothauera rhizosphaerae TaxID=2565932 RepID=A0A4S4ACW2_9RHOO|nr:(2Fe-2S)-binding protein [Pseudothauera rhizosphaerae]THF56880.1 bacterioferritin [Pseudothauera rhizosphaerae]
MYVCVCNAVTERHIHDAVEQGVKRMRDLRDHLGVAADCGRCATCAHSCLKSALGSQAASTPQAFPAAFSLVMEAR